MTKQSTNHRMAVPRNVSLPLSDYHKTWYYQELVVRFGQYKAPIRSVEQVSHSLGIPCWDVVNIVRMDRQHAFLDTDEKHIWMTTRCSKVRLEA